MLKDLRRQAIAASLFRPTTLRQAVERMGFVQADPIRAPARAQDLILRHRVKDYRVGDLERHYDRLGLEEDRFYAHGFLPQSTWRLLPSRAKRRLTTLEKRVLEVVANHKRVHPADLEAHFGRKRATNGWGGQSKATTRALHYLHHYGFLRVVGRERGIRVYEAALPPKEQVDPNERFRQIVLIIASILGPLSDRSLRASLFFLGHRGPTLAMLRGAVPNLIESGELSHATVNGTRYLWRTGQVVARRPLDETVRFLCPFDPLVWDRRRFEEFWGWPYRFEAYVPAPKRKLGYYAMPLLWREEMIGWVNASTKNGKLAVEAGFRNGKPRDRDFATQFEAEITRLSAFLQKRDRTVSR